MAIFEIAKNGIWSINFFREIDLFDFTSFFGLDFLHFLASCVAAIPVQHPYSHCARNLVMLVI